MNHTRHYGTRSEQHLRDLLGNASRDIYEQNTHADFTVEVAQRIDLRSTSNWEVGVCDISCSSSPEAVNPSYSTLTLYLRNYWATASSVAYGRLGYYPTQSDSTSNRYVQYVPVEQRKFQNIRIEFLTTDVLHIPTADTSIATKEVLHFSKNYQW